MAQGVKHSSCKHEYLSLNLWNQLTLLVCVARILIGPNNKTMESEIGVNAERSERQSSQPPGNSHLYQCSVQMCDPVSMKPQTACSD